MNVPNSLSVFRLVLIPVFCVTFLLGPDYYIWSGLALALSALSDLLDGYFARKLNQITELGKWLDPIADKLTLGAVVVCMWLSMHDEYPLVTPMFAILIGKELFMAVGGLIVTRGREEMVPSQWWGKLGTAVFYTCMFALVMISIFDIGGEYKRAIVISLVTLPTAAMIFALFRYIIFAVRLLQEKDSDKRQEISE